MSVSPLTVLPQPTIQGKWLCYICVHLTFPITMLADQPTTVMDAVCYDNTEESEIISVCKVNSATQCDDSKESIQCENNFKVDASTQYVESFKADASTQYLDSFKADASTQYLDSFKADASTQCEVQCIVELISETTQTDTAAIHQIIQTDELDEDSEVTPFKIEQIEDNDKLVNFYIGFPSFLHHLTCFHFLGSAVTALSYDADKNVQDPTKVCGMGQHHILTPINKFFLTCRLRLGLLVQDLAIRFKFLNLPYQE